MNQDWYVTADETTLGAYYGYFTEIYQNTAATAKGVKFYFYSDKSSYIASNLATACSWDTTNDYWACDCKWSSTQTVCAMAVTVPTYSISISYQSYN